MLFADGQPEHVVGIHDAAAMISATGAVASTIAITSVYFFIAARVILSVGEPETSRSN